MKDVSGTWLEVKIDSPAIQKDKLHGWIIKYTVLAKRETDSQGHMIIVNFNGRDGKMPKRINYINTFIRYKNESQMQDGKWKPRHKFPIIKPLLFCGVFSLLIISKKGCRNNT